MKDKEMLGTPPKMDQEPTIEKTEEEQWIGATKQSEEQRLMEAQRVREEELAAKKAEIDAL